MKPRDDVVASFHTLCPLGNVIAGSSASRPNTEAELRSFALLEESETPRKRDLQPSSGPLAKQSLGARGFSQAKRVAVCAICSCW